MWAIKEDRDGTMWWMIRGGAWSNVVNNKYPHKLWDSKEEADKCCADTNRRYYRKGKVVEVVYNYGSKKKTK